VPEPTLRAAAGLGGRALARNGWLVAVGLVVGVARRALGVLGALVAGVLVARGGAEAAAHAPFSPAAGIAGAIEVATSPRFLALVAGLWLAGVLLAGALRVAWVTGSLATLGRDLSGAPDAPPRFAGAIAYDLPRVLGTALLAAVAEWTGLGFALAIVVAAARISAAAAGQGARPLLAAAVALALTLAVAVPFVLSVAADAAVARAALRGERPARAVASALGRLALRPGAFLLGAMAFAVGAGAATVAIETVGGALTGLAAGVNPLLLAGPQLMIAAALLAVGAAAELWWLGTVAVLACRD
jgi:hypothetical protein